ncbi:MAG: HAMP domain-containing histidine kinase [Rhodobacteraceae bacterium]|nr:HAMP domain-containing histidine kinase [Paracoccaceae bacterium]MBR9822601.1 HAMP domain-containing histidine kinase [Paracoccaceae bacterium]
MNAPPLSDAPQGQPPASADAELEQFLYVITHDLRAAFRAFQTLPDWIREDMGPLPADRAATVDGHIDMLVAQASRCDRMLLDLRDYSRIGRCADSPAEHALDDLIGRALVRAPLPSGFTLTVEGGGMLHGPANELVLLLCCLISNAVKHHDSDRGALSLRVAGGGPMRRCEFSDDGPGIPPRFHEAVFDMLRTLRPRDQCEGSGMGLAIARRIVTRLGGAIAITDTGTTRGTTLSFTLPGRNPEVPPRMN